jgi:hypothetical protein
MATFTPQPIIGKTYRNEVVPIDGFRFDRCSFYG